MRHRKYSNLEMYFLLKLTGMIVLLTKVSMKMCGLGAGKQSPNTQLSLVGEASVGVSTGGQLPLPQLPQLLPLPQQQLPQRPLQQRPLQPQPQLTPGLTDSADATLLDYRGLVLSLCSFCMVYGIVASNRHGFVFGSRLHGIRCRMTRIQERGVLAWTLWSQPVLAIRNP